MYIYTNTVEIEQAMTCLNSNLNYWKFISTVYQMSKSHTCCIFVSFHVLIHVKVRSIAPVLSCQKNKLEVLNSFPNLETKLFPYRIYFFCPLSPLIPLLQHTIPHSQFL